MSHSHGAHLHSRDLVTSRSTHKHTREVQRRDDEDDKMTHNGMTSEGCFA